MKFKLKSAEVYLNPKDNLLYRIIMADNIFMYAEVYMNGEWSTIMNIHKKNTFYGTSVDAFLARHPQYLRQEPFSKEEFAILRPDLPLSIGRTNRFDWLDIINPGVENLEMILFELFPFDLKVEKIYVHPLGKNGGRRKEVEILPDEKGNFRVAEIILKSAKIQNESFSEIKEGIGLFRFGVKNKYPTYVIDNYYFSNSDAYVKFDEKFDWEAYFKEADS